MQKKKTVVRLTINAMLIAIYIVLSLPIFAINLGGGIKFTFEHFPVLLCAVLFGPIDALTVGLLGELFNQLTSFGLTPTTALWVLPIVVRGLIVGIFAKAFKQQLSVKHLVKVKVPLLFLCVCAVSGIISSCLNTIAFYVDSKMFGYYVYEQVFGVFWLRIGLSVLTSIVMGVVITPILYALKRSKLV